MIDADYSETIHISRKVLSDSFTPSPPPAQVTTQRKREWSPETAVFRWGFHPAKYRKISADPNPNRTEPFSRLFGSRVSPMGNFPFREKVLPPACRGKMFCPFSFGPGILPAAIARENPSRTSKFSDSNLFRQIFLNEQSHLQTEILLITSLFIIVYIYTMLM